MVKIHDFEVKGGEEEVVDLPSLHSADSGSVAVVLEHHPTKTLFVASESRATRDEVEFKYGKPCIKQNSTHITRQQDAKPLYPCLHPELIGQKIYECDDFIAASTGDARFTSKVCNQLLDKARNGKKVTHSGLREKILDEFRCVTNANIYPSSFVIATPEGYGGAEFEITKVVSSDKNPITVDRYTCIGRGQADAANYIDENHKEIWDRGNSVDQVRSIIRDSVYSAIDKNRLELGGIITVYSCKVGRSPQGKKILIKEVVVYPPLKDVVTMTLRTRDITYGLHFAKTWFKEYVSQHWNNKAVKNIMELKHPINITVQFYPKVKHNRFYKRPRQEHPPFTRYTMKLKCSEDSNDLLVLGETSSQNYQQFCQQNNITPENSITIMEDFEMFCRKYKLKRGTTVQMFWENETASFNLWVLP